MVLLVAEQGPLCAAIEDRLTADGLSVSVVSPEAEDLWTPALNQRAVVYLPAARLLDGCLDPQPSSERMRDVLGAAEAPGVEVVVPVFPRHPRFEPEITALKRHGKPYAALTAPPLAEEVAEVMSGSGSLWVPRQGALEIARAETVAAAVRDAIETELQGRVTDVPAERLDAAALCRRAADARGLAVRVRGVWPWLYRLANPLFRWLQRGETRLLELLDRLYPRLAPAGFPPALPASPRRSTDSSDSSR